MALTFRAAGANATGTTSLSIAQPAGTVNGDILVAFVLDHATSGTSAAPTGWTNNGSSSGAAGRFQVFTAVVGQNSLGASPWTFSGLTSRAQGVIVGYSGGAGTQPDVAVSARNNASGTTGTTSITPVTDESMIVAGFANYTAGGTWSAEAVATAPTLVERFDSPNGSFCSIAIADGSLATAAATGASSATMSANTTNAGILIALRAVIMTYDVFDPNQLYVPFMWTLGVLQILAETEQFDWGWMPPVTKVSRDEIYYENAPFQISFVPEIEDEMFSWGQYFAGYESDTLIPPVQQRSMVPEIEDEMFSWGWMLFNDIVEDDAPYDSQPKFRSYLISEFESETEQFDWGFNLSAVGGSGTNLMGFRGARSLKAAMGSEVDNWAFNAPVVIVNPSFDQDDLLHQKSIYPEIEDEMFSWGWMPPVPATTRDEVYYENPPLQQTIIPEIEEEMNQWGLNSVALGAGTVEMMGFRGFRIVPGAMGLPEEFGFQQAVVTVVSAFDQDELPVMSLLIPEIEDDMFSWGYGVGVSAGTQLMGFKGWLLRAGMGYEVESIGFEPVIALDVDQHVIQPQPTVQWTDDDSAQSTFFSAEQYADIDEQFVSQYQSARHDTDSDMPFVVVIATADEQTPLQSSPVTSDTDSDQFGFQTPVVVIITAYDQDELPPFVMSPSDKDTDQFGQQPVCVSEEFGIELVPSVWQGTDEDTSQSTFFALEQFGEVQEFGPPQQLSYFISDKDTEQFGQQPVFVQEDIVTPVTTDQVKQGVDEDTSQSTFFATEQYADVEEQAGFQLRTFFHDEDFGFNTPALIGALVLDQEIPLPMIRQLVMQWTDDDSAQSTFFAAEQYADIDEQFVVPVSLIRDDTEQPNFSLAFAHDVDYTPLPASIVTAEDEPFGFKTAVITLPFDADFNPAQQISYYFTQLEDEMFNWGWMPPVTKTSQDDSPYDYPPQLRSFYFQYLDLEQFNWGFDASKYFSGYESDTLVPPVQMRSYFVPEIEDDMFNWGFNQPVVTVVTAFDTDMFPVAQLNVISYDQDEGRVIGWSDVAIDYIPMSSLSSTSEADAGNFTIAFVDTESMDRLIPPVVTQDTGDDTSNFVFVFVDTENVDRWLPPILTQDMGETEIGNFVVTVIFVDTDIQHRWTQQMSVYDMGEPDTSNFVLSFVDIESVDRLMQWIVVQEEDVFGERAPFITSFPIDDSPEQLPLVPIIRDDTVPFGQAVSFNPYDDSLEQIPIPYIIREDVEQPLFTVQYTPQEEDIHLVKTPPQYYTDEPFGFRAPVANEQSAYDTEFNPPQQYLFYFTDIDVEEFEWGFNIPPIVIPPTTAFVYKASNFLNVFITKVRRENAVFVYKASSTGNSKAAATKAKVSTSVYDVINRLSVNVTLIKNKASRQ